MAARIRSLVGSSLVTLAVAAAVTAQDTAPERPNVVLIYADDLGYGDLGCYGATHVRTPHLDALAQDGRRFTDAHSASAVCSPSRYGLLTGRYPLRRNLWGPIGKDLPLVVDTERPTLASVLRGAGYATACIGKWHLGFGTEGPDWNGELAPGPLELGFDHYFGLPVVNSSAPYVYVEDHHVVGLDPADPFVRGERSVTEEWPAKGGYGALGGARLAHLLYRDDQVATNFARHAVDWIERTVREDAERPFFLYLATTNVHHPFTPAKRFRGTSDCGRYGDFVHELDWLVGEVLGALDATGIADDTLVVFTSDNGGMLNAGGQDAWKAGHRLNGDLLGFKFGAWEGGHRVPLIARWPGRIPAGTESDALFSQVDLLATLATVAGATVPAGAAEDSLDQLEAWVASPSPSIRTELIVSPNRPSHLMIRRDDWVYIGAPDEGGFGQKNPGDHCFGGGAALPFTGRDHSDFVDGVLRPEAPPAQLYDLGADPGQTTNVVADQPEVAAALARRLEAIRALVPAGRPIGWIDRR